MNIPGEEWKGEGSVPTPEDIKKYARTGTKILVEVAYYHGVMKAKVVGYELEGEVVELAYSMWRGLVKRTDMKVLALVPLPSCEADKESLDKLTKKYKRMMGEYDG